MKRRFLQKVVSSHEMESTFTYDCVGVMQLCVKMRDQTEEKKIVAVFPKV